MSNIIAGDPAPTNPTARENLTSYADRYGYTEEVNALIDAAIAEALAERDVKRLCSAFDLGEGSDAFIADYDARKRAEVLAEAITGLDQVFRLAPVPGTSDGINYAIGVLMSMRGESR